MPTRAQENAVADALQRVMNSGFTREGNSLLQAEDGKLRFADLSESEKAVMLAAYATWAGFSPEEEMTVIENIIDGQPRGHWMDDVIAAEDRESMANEGICNTPEEHARYLHDIAASYGMTAQQMDDYYTELMLTDAWVDERDGMPTPEQHRADMLSIRSERTLIELEGRGVDYSDAPYAPDAATPEAQGGDDTPASTPKPPGGREYAEILRHAIAEAKHRAKPHDKSRHR